MCILSSLKRNEVNWVSQFCTDFPWMTNMPVCRVKQQPGPKSFVWDRVSLCNRNWPASASWVPGFKGALGHPALTLSLRPKRKMWDAGFSPALMTSWDQWGSKLFSKSSLQVAVVSSQHSKGFSRPLRLTITFVWTVSYLQRGLNDRHFGTCPCPVHAHLSLCHSAFPPSIISLILEESPAMVFVVMIC